MSFVLDLVKFDDLPTTTVNGKRHYISNGKKYPSVTTVLDYCSDKTALMEWRKRVGAEEAERISSRARNRGTAMHSLCEKLVLNHSFDFEEEMPTTVMMYKQLEKILKKNVDNIKCVEECLVSHHLGVAGRVDLIASYDDEVSIIDFKTSTKLKKKDHITNYFQQASLYSYMFWEMTGILAKKIVILIAVESETEPQIFVESTKKYVKDATEMVKRYHAAHPNL